MAALTEETTEVRFLTPAIVSARCDFERMSCEDCFFAEGKAVIDCKGGNRVKEGNETDCQLCFPGFNRPHGLTEKELVIKWRGDRAERARLGAEINAKLARVCGILGIEG